MIYEKIGSTAVTMARRRAVVAKIQRRTAPQEKWVNRLGYHSIVSNYTGGNTVNRLSGSSINKKMRNDEKTAKSGNFEPGKGQAFTAIRTAMRTTGIIPAWVCPGILSQDEVDKFQDNQRVQNGVRRHDKQVHMLSQRSKSIVRARFTAFYRACAGRKTFCTLTFVNDVTDTVAVTILNKFLTVLRKQFKNLQYIWVAERQENGRIHFHAVINVYIPIKRWNALWVLQQYNSGVTHPKFSYNEVLQFANTESMKDILNPVDVRRVKNISQLSNYLTKYITKGDNKGEFGCAVWHCSREVSRLYLRTIVSWEVVQLAKSEANARFSRSTGEYYGPPEHTTGRVGRKGGFLYVVYHLNQPGRFLCYLREMEQINKWIIDKTASVADVVAYLKDQPFPETLYSLN